MSKFAIIKDTEQIVHATLERKSNAVYLCPDCNESVILKKGTIKAHHFSHRKLSNCTFYKNPTESQMHKDGKLMIKSILENVCRKKSTLTIINKCKCTKKTTTTNIMLNDDLIVKIEYPFQYNGTKIADVACLDMDKNIKYIFEIFHTHRTKEEARPEPFFEIEASSLTLLNPEGEITLTCCRDLSDKCTCYEEEKIKAEEELRKEKIKAEEELLKQESEDDRMIDSFLQHLALDEKFIKREAESDEFRKKVNDKLQEYIEKIKDELESLEYSESLFTFYITKLTSIEEALSHIPNIFLIKSSIKDISNIENKYKEQEIKDDCLIELLFRESTTNPDFTKREIESTKFNIRLRDRLREYIAKIKEELKKSKFSTELFTSHITKLSHILNILSNFDNKDLINCSIIDITQTKQKEDAKTLHVRPYWKE